MRLLIDSCVGIRTQTALRQAGHDLTQAQLCVDVLRTHEQALLAGAIITVQPGVIRIRQRESA